MYDGGKIIAGLVIFILIVAFPFYANLGKAKDAPEPSIDTPTINALAVKKCIEPKEFMRAEHMQMLDDWRDWVVRDGNRVFVNSEGKSFDMSLQNTCMDCHSNKEKFCDKCHTYMAVKPYCWDCHLEPEERQT